MVKKKKTSDKLKKQISKGTLGQKLLGMNPYLRTILDPFNVTKVKIPDDVTTHSCPFSITQRFPLTVDAQGYCGVFLGAYPCTVLNTGVQPFFFSGSLIPMQTLDAAPVTPWAYGAKMKSTVGGVLFGDTGNVLVYDQWQATASGVPQTFTNNRLVSMGARITFTGTVLNAQGLITAWSNPRETYGNNNDVALGGISLSFLQKLENSSIYSVPKEGGAMVVYIPQDPISQQYCPAKQSNTYASEAVTKYLGGEMGFVVSGAIANQTFEVEVTSNFEGEPYLNTLSLTQATPSKSDPIALAHATNVLAAVKPSMGISKQEALKTVPVADAITHHASDTEPTMMEQVLGGLTGVASAMPAVSKIAQTMGPLIGSVLGMI